MAADTRFKPGVSGNPSGRPSLDPALKTRLADLTPRALEVLEQGLSSADERIRLQSATALLDRALGKPAATVDATVRQLVVDLNAAHLETLEALLKPTEPDETGAK